MPKLVNVGVYNLVAEAELAMSTLDDAGIKSYLADSNIVAMEWFIANAVGGVKLQVAQEDAEAAEQILSQIRTDSKDRKAENTALGDIHFNCENCHKPLTFPGERRGGVETCRHCGKYVDVPEEEMSDT